MSRVTERLDALLTEVEASEEGFDYERLNAELHGLYGAAVLDELDHGEDRPR